MSPRIQIAFQGGGAKLLAMLPVAHAFQKAEERRRIEIGALAGTSAGAICAALLASKCNFEALRAHLVGEGSKYLSRLPTKSFEILRDLSNASALENTFKLPSIYDALRSIYKDGAPLLNQEILRELLQSAFSFCRVDPDDEISKFENLHVISTNLSALEGEIRRRGSLIDAVMDSCALPLGFRSFGELGAVKGSHYVDGGLCENLPIECLITSKTDPIFAVYPVEKANAVHVNNLSEYLFYLFGVVIENNVKQSRKLLTDGFDIPIRCGFSTFEFDEALNCYKDGNFYDGIFNDAMKKIMNFSNTWGIVDNAYKEKRFYSSSPTINSHTINDYIAALDRLTLGTTDHVEMLECILIFRIICDETNARDEDLINRPADVMLKKVRFKIKSSNFRYYRAGISVGPGIGPSIWNAYNISTEKYIPIEVHSLDLRRTEAPTKRQCAVEFLDLENLVDVGHEILLTDTSHREDGLVEINKGENTNFKLTNPHAFDVPKMSLIIKYPRNIGRITLTPDTEFASKYPTCNIKSIKQAPDEDDPLTFRVGVTVENFPAKQMLSCDVLFSPR